MKINTIIIIIGAAALTMTMSAYANEETPIHRIDSIEAYSENGLINEPTIEEVSYEDVKDDLIVAPKPNDVINHDAEEGGKTIENIVGEDLDPAQPHILADEHNSYNSEEKLILPNAENTEANEEIQKSEARIPTFVVIGFVVFVGFCLIIIRKKKE